MTRYLLPLFLLASCAEPEEVRMGTVIPEGDIPAAARLLVDLCEASNPHSDEEPEDMIREARRAVMEIYGRDIVGIEFTGNGGTYLGWTPYDQLPGRLQYKCDKWKHEAEAAR